MSSNELDEIEDEAKATAEKMVMNMMQRPGQLEKVEQYKRRIMHKKASIEAQLKSAVQGKLDGVSVGLKQLQECLDDVNDISLKMDELEEVLNGVPPLVASLQAVREEDSRHSQYETAMDSLKHIFTVPESVAKTKQWIGEGKLLHAHQCLTDLENSRDDLLYELHRLPNQSQHDKIMLKAYFEDVETVSNELEKQIKLILRRTLNTVRKEPTVIVTALRIIEREEKRDQMHLQQQSQSGFMPPGRPKSWRKMAFDTLRSTVEQRIQGTRVQEREDSKMWLVPHLELTRQLIVEDLRVVKSLCVPCFPPHYDIVSKYVDMYHTELSTYLQEIAASGLEGREEHVHLLSWVLTTYPGVEMMNSPELCVDVSERPPLLPEDSMAAIQRDYLQNMEVDYRTWMDNTLGRDRAQWEGDAPPECEPGTRAYQTPAPIIIFQMISQCLRVTETISKELTFQALLLSIEQVTRYGTMYRDGVIQFKNQHFADRSRTKYFTEHMISIVNNSEQLVRLAQQVQAQHWPPARHDPPAEAKFEKMLKTFQSLRDEATQILLEEAFLDMEKHFDDLFTSKWLQSSHTGDISTICETLKDYFSDYNHLREKNFENVLNEAQHLVYRKYITAMLSKKVSFKTTEEAQKAAAKIMEEAKKIKLFFKSMAPEAVDCDWPFNAVKKLAVVLECQDMDMLSLDLHDIVEQCPDVTEDHLVRLVWLRGEWDRAQTRGKVADAMATKRESRTHQPTMFKHIVFVDRLRERFAL